MNKTITHTPTPWELHHVSNGIELSRHGNAIATVHRYGAGRVPEGEQCPWHDYEANAAFIVRAVNSYEAMREALKELEHMAHGARRPGAASRHARRRGVVRDCAGAFPSDVPP
jgi:hypothetical protein